MSITELLPALHDLSLEEKLQAMQFLCEDVEKSLVNGNDLSSNDEVLTKVHDSLRERLRLYQQRSDEVRASETRLTLVGHGLSLRELVKLPLTERHRLLSPFVAEMAEDFTKNPNLTEFAVLDGEDWNGLDESFQTWRNLVGSTRSDKGARDSENTPCRVL